MATEKITKNLFDLTPEQIETSKSMYGGKIIKCLIAPYHSIKDIPLEPNNEVFVYPERDLNIQQRKEIVGIMANSNKEEICFVTSDLFIILDMVDVCCRILTPEGKIEKVDEKTFGANPHTIIYKVIHNAYYVKEQEDKSLDFRQTINKIIDEVNNKKGMTVEQYEANRKKINLIGEPLIKNRLLDMLREVKIIKEEYVKDNLTGKLEFTAEETEFIKSLSWYSKDFTIKQCAEKSEKDISITQEIFSSYDKLLELYGNDSKYEKEKKEKLAEKVKIEKELRMRHKIDYWLSEQDEKVLLSSLVK